MRYRTFFEINLVHPYAPNIQEYLLMKPDASTQRVLRAYNLLLKETTSGFKILIPTTEEGINETVFEPTEKLVFKLFSASNDFLEFTDFSTIDANEILLFTNQDLISDAVDLQITATSPNEKLNSFPAVGKIEISLNAFIAPTDQEAPTYNVHFNAKSIIWKYYFITKEATDFLSIKNQTILFKPLNNEAVDPVFKGLETNSTFSGFQIHAFESEEPVTFQKKPRKDIQLKNDSTIIIKHLPNPDLGNQGIKIIRIN